MKSSIISTLIYIPLGVLVILAFVILIFGNNFSFYSGSETITSISIINGTITEKVTNYSLNFGISIQEGILSLIVGITVVVALIGLQILGSGLNDETVRVLTVIITYIGVWTFLSSFTYDLFLMVAWFWIIYWFFTFLYVFGVVEKITGGNS